VTATLSARGVLLVRGSEVSAGSVEVEAGMGHHLCARQQDRPETMVAQWHASWDLGVISSALCEMGVGKSANPGQECSVALASPDSGCADQEPQLTRQRLVTCSLRC
jgi:hypothetical protein